MTLEYPEIFISEAAFTEKLHPPTKECKRIILEAAECKKRKPLSKICKEIILKATKCKKSSSTVNYWIQGKNPNSKSRIKICEIFGLRDEVWTNPFNTTRSFRESLQTSKIITNDITIDSKVASLILNSTVEITKEEENMLEEKLNNNIDLIEITKDKDPSFLFKFTKKLKKENKIVEALKVLELIETHSSTYKYTHHNQIKHLKAILLSHDDIKEWDEAIDILKRLYSSAKYHLEENEIITLIASNYKRKALYQIDKSSLELNNKVNMDLLVSAISLYKEAYNLKDSQKKYYDAINIAYLLNIIDSIEVEDANPSEITKLYSELSEVWRPKDDNWWEVSSKTEFLMLLGKVDSAISRINNFLELNINNVTEFEINTTLRQLKIYIHFTQDKNAIKFHDNLKISWKALKES